MPWKLVPPHTRKDGKKIEFYYVRGKYCGLAIDRSTGTGERRAATAILNTWKRQAERGEFSKPVTAADPGLFLNAVKAYLLAGGDRTYTTPISEKWAMRRIEDIDQVAIDTLAAELYPNAPASTRNRQVYTPVSAILKHVGVDKKIKRPKGWRGNKGTFWLKPEPTFALLAAAERLDAEFGILCTTLNYCGFRLSEALGLEIDKVDLSRSYAYVPDTKTGEPRAVYLPPVVVSALANHPQGLDRKGKLFRFHKSGRLYELLDEACKAAGIELPRRVAFHVFRHNYGTWMRLYGGLDDIGLLRTGVWADMDSVERYSHSEPTREARQAAQLPTPKRGQVVDLKRKAT